MIAGEAIINDTLSSDDFRHVQAMCLYALELAHQGRAETYTDSDADLYARYARYARART